MRDVFTRVHVHVPTLHVASCSVECSVDELHCCAGSAKGEQLSKALLLRRDDRLRRVREEPGTTLEQA